MKTLISGLWTFSKSIWNHRNAVVHGKTETRKVSKEITLLQQDVTKGYNEYNQDPYFIPRSRAHLFDRPLSATLSMDRDGLDCWLSLVKEACLTTAMHQQLLTRSKQNTLFHYFSSVTHVEQPSKKYTAKALFNPPFSVAYYMKNSSSRVKGTVKRRLNRKTPRRSIVAQANNLFTCGFFKLPPPSARISKSQAAEEAVRTEYSGTLLSTAP
jgi:hypothetical protein